MIFTDEDIQERQRNISKEEATWEDFQEECAPITTQLIEGLRNNYRKSPPWATQVAFGMKFAMNKGFYLSQNREEAIIDAIYGILEKQYADDEEESVVVITAELSPIKYIGDKQELSIIFSMELPKKE